MAVDALCSSYCNTPTATSQHKRLSQCRSSTNSTTSQDVKRSKSRSTKRTRDVKSPYLSNDKVQGKSRVTRMTPMQKGEQSFASSFLLAANIYKTNSDEFKFNKLNMKKNKKSVLTLPNLQAPKQQQCTVSDTNDSELFNRDLTQNEKRSTFPKKRVAPLGNRRSISSELFGRKTKSSSFEMVTQFEGDVQKKKKKNHIQSENSKYKVKTCNVWSILRNMNNFQFQESPTISEDSIGNVKRKKVNLKKRYPKDQRFIQSRQEEEIQYISNFEIETLSASNSFDHGSSSSRVTVIDRHDLIQDLCDEFQERIEQIERASCNKELVHIQTLQTKNKRRNRRSPLRKKRLHLKENPQTEILKQGEEKTPKNNSNFSFEVDKINSNIKIKMNLSSEHCSTVSSNKDSKDSTKSQTLDIYTKPVNSIRSSMYKAKKHIFLDKADCQNNETILTPIESPLHSVENLCGITQVLLGESKMNTPALNNRCALNKEMERPNTSSRYRNTKPMPHHKISIKSRLDHLNFPITILGPNQISSTYPVVMFDPPQFEVLGDKIWPFMTNWFRENNNSENVENNHNRISEKVNKVFQYRWNKKTDLPSRNAHIKNQRNDLASVNGLAKQAVNSKSISQFKDKMLKFLCNKTPTHKGTKILQAKNSLTEAKDNSDSGVNVKDAVSLHREYRRPLALKSLIKQSNKQDKTGHTWAKAKRASDFIENVISKIKTGVYYTPENGFSINKISESKEMSKIDKSIDKIESIVTVNVSTLEHNEFYEYDNSEKQSKEMRNLESDTVKTIDAFDETFPGLEVETLNNNRVAIKNCILNVLVHFDIAAPATLKSAFVQESSSYIPVSVSSNNTQIFKCTTTIKNGMLPAELCSMLPNIMRNISNTSILPQGLPALETNEASSKFVSEIFKGEGNTFDYFRFDNNLKVSANVKGMRNGRFNTLTIKHMKRNCAANSYFHHVHDVNVPSTILQSLRKLLFCMDPIHFKMFENPHSVKSSKETVELEFVPQCTALIPYSPLDKKTMYIFNSNNQQFSKCNQGLANKTIELNIYGFFPEISTFNSFPNMITNSPNYDKLNENKCTALIEYTKPLRFELLERMDRTNLGKKNVRKPQMLKKKLKNKAFARVFQKCKSNPKTKREQCTTAISKITSIRKLFFALGAKQTLCSVFDKTAERKIINCIVEMKNWVSEISPTQIMLVILLSNKKETLNMVKMRPIILQAIAAKRITNSSELEMEVEVIEKERFSKFLQYEDVSYLPTTSSSQNNNNLLEELYWIAKTTASDYQRPFNESSERLLKSLLEKRKKLNPSYLRVLARYVGLGLLKKTK